MQTPSMRSIAFIYLVTILSAHAAAMPGPDSNTPGARGAQPEFIVHNWYVEDGLPHNGVNNIVRDTRGFLWLATSGGIARFDGRNFVEYPMPAELALGRYNIRGLAVEDEHTMLAINAANKLLRLRNGQYEPHPARALLPRGTALRDLAVDAAGAVWIGTDTPSLIRWTKDDSNENGRIEIFANEPGFARRTTPFCIVSDENNRTWISAGDFLGWYENGRLHRHEKQNLHSITIAKSRLGGLWVASRENLARLDTTRGTWNTVLADADWPVRRSGLQDFHESETGVLWLATRRESILRLIDGRLTPLPLRHDRVQAINEDINGDIWLGVTGGGLAHLKPNHHVILNTDTGFPTDISTSVTVDETGALWCANQSGGLVRHDNGQTTLIKPAARPTLFVTNVCADQRGTVWAGTTNGLYSTPVRDDSGARILTRLDAPVSNVQTLYCAPNGDLWMSWANEFIGVVRDGRLTTFTAGELPRMRVASIAGRKGPQGPEIWIAFENGQLFQVRENAPGNEDKIINKTHLSGPRAGQLHTLFADSENRLWLGSTNGLILLRDDAPPRIFTQADGLPDNIINQVIADNHDRLWISSRRGIFHVSIKQLLAAAASPGAPVTPRLFGRDDNLAGISGMVGGQPMAWKGGDGRTWFVTYRGIVGFDTIGPDEKPKPPPVYIDGVRTDGAPAALPPKGPLRIAPGATQIELHFAALGFASPERTRVRRILEGFDLDWTDATSERLCAYPHLPAGRYLFRIEASNGDGGASRNETSLEIIIAAAWWQTLWFRLLAILACAAAIAWIARKLSNRILKQRLRRLEHEHALSRERTRISRDLHDELGGRVTKIGYIADRLAHEEERPVQKTLIASLLAQSRQLVEELHGIVWTVNPKNDSWQQLAAYILRHTQRLLSDTPFTHTVDGVDSIPDTPITPEARHNILSITKETLNNMLKHSQASRVTIRMSADSACFRMEIKDDGRGFDPAAPHNNEGNGLFNMRARMAEIGGRIDIVSAPGAGAAILIEAPLDRRAPRTRHARTPLEANAPDANQSRHS